MLNPSKKRRRYSREKKKKKKKSNRGKIMNNTIFFFFNLPKHRLKIIEQGYFTIDQILTSASLAASCALQEKKKLIMFWFMVLFCLETN
jgi:hypothetical protein